MLGYGIDDTSHDFTCIEDNIRSQAASASSQMLCATREMGFDVTAEDMAGLAGGITGRTGGPGKCSQRHPGQGRNTRTIPCFFPTG